MKLVSSIVMDRLHALGTHSTTIDDCLFCKRHNYLEEQFNHLQGSTVAS